MDRAHAAKLRTLNAAQFLRRRRRNRIVLFSFTVLVIASVIVDRAISSTIDDWSRFNHQTFVVTKVLAGDRVVVQAGKNDQTIALLGIAAPTESAANAYKSREYSTARLLQQPITLLLTKPQTRDANGNLLAFVFPSNTDNLNVDLVHDGFAFVDRRETGPMQSLLDAAESDARKKSRGMWESPKFSDMPQWRQDWIKKLIAKKTETR